MVVCRFFMQGNCRYGNNCYNEHPSGGSQGYSVTAQRQLFGGGGGNNRNQQSQQSQQNQQNQRVSFRDSYGANQNPYRWVSQDAQQRQQQNKPVAQTAELSSADIVKSLAGEVTQTWEGGKMWPFTCLGFDKESSSLPGFTDMSFEELRLEAYEAQSAGTTAAYIQKVQTLYQEVNTRRQELKAPNMTLKQKLISFIEDSRKKKQSSSGNQVSLFSDSSLFGSSSSAPAPSGLFGNQSSTFGNQSSTFGQPQTANQSTFGQPANQSLFGQSGSQSLFGKPAQAGSQTFGQPSQPTTGFGLPAVGPASNAFGQQPTTGFGSPSTGTSIFGQVVGQPSDAPQTPKANLFGTPQGNSTPFAGASQIATPTQNPFGQSPVVPSASSTFGQAPVAATMPQQPASSTDTSSPVYTPLDKLTPQELEQFKANTFTVGMIPTRPPPKELCF